MIKLKDLLNERMYGKQLNDRDKIRLTTLSHGSG